MKRLLRFFVVIATFLTASCGNAPSETKEDKPAPNQPAATLAPEGTNPWVDRGCELFGEADLQGMYQVDPKRDVLNARSLPGKAYCLHTWMRPNWKQTESDNEKPGATYKEFKNTLAVEVINFGTAVQAAERMTLTRSDQRQMYSTDVPGLGDDALWAPSANTLLVAKGHLLLNIMFDYADTPEGNLEAARQVAATVLPRL